MAVTMWLLMDGGCCASKESSPPLGFKQGYAVPDISYIFFLKENTKANSVLCMKEDWSRDDHLFFFGLTFGVISLLALKPTFLI